MDLKGTGTPGILWAQGQLGPGRAAMYFLDLTGGQKPYMLREMDNNMGAVTRVAYEPSTATYIDDQWDEATRWETPLPFPVQTVSRVEVIDEVSGGKMTTEYSYHHGYWDGHEREFRGFARVEQTDTEAFVDYETEGLFPDKTFEAVDQDSFSKPVTVKHWFMLGGVTHAAGAWSVPDFSEEWWQHPSVSNHPNELLGDWAYAGDATEGGKEGWTLEQKLDAMDFDRRREALRALRGRTPRTETYSTEGPTARQARPYTVTEQIHSLRTDGEGPAGTETRGILFPYGLATRTTQWDRGDDPMTRFQWSRSHTAYGQPTETLTVACPRGWQRPDATLQYAGAEPERLELFLTTYGTTDYIHVDQPGQYMVDRVAESESWGVTDPGDLTLTQFKTAVDQADWNTAPRTVQAHTRNYYDGNGFEGLALGQIGAHGAMVRAEQLVLTDDIVDQAYPSGATAPDDTGPPVYLEADAPTWTAEYPQAFRDRIDGLGDRAGYLYESGRYYVESDRAKYDFQDGATTPRGLPVAQKSKADHVTTIDYDAYDTRPIEVTDTLDGVDHVTEATYDYQAFKPSKVTDVNDNRTQVAYTPLGMVEKVARQGKPTESKGDTLATPGQALTYDLTYGGPTEPVSVTTTAREYHVHDNEVPGWADADATIETVEFSDGFGRVVQTRTQAEELDYGDAGLPTGYGQTLGDAVPTTDANRVRVSGWTRFNNKGEPVETWEPFFASGQGFGDLVAARAGESVQTRYDARGRATRTIRPDGAESWMVHGVPGTLASPDISTPETFEPTPWEVYTYEG
jgi:hypothetical protein